MDGMKQLKLTADQAASLQRNPQLPLLILDNEQHITVNDHVKLMGPKGLVGSLDVSQITIKQLDEFSPQSLVLDDQKSDANQPASHLQGDLSLLNQKTGVADNDVSS